MALPQTARPRSAWATAIDEYLDEKQAAGISRHTLGLYRYALEGVLLSYCELHKLTSLAELTAPHLNALVRGLLDGSEARSGRPLAKPSVDTYARTINYFLSWLAKQGQAPPARAQRQRLPRRLREVLTREEVVRLEASAPHERDKLIIRLLADTGMRVSELVGLTPADLHERGHKWYLKVRGKGDEEREVPISPSMASRLHHYVKRARPQSAHPNIFLGIRRGRGAADNEPLTTSGVEQRIRDLGFDVLGRRIFPHLFRHSFVTWCAQREMRETDVAKVIGHSSLRMIHEVYEHLDSSDTHDALMRHLLAADRR